MSALELRSLVRHLMILPSSYVREATATVLALKFFRSRVNHCFVTAELSSRIESHVTFWASECDIIMHLHHVNFQTVTRGILIATFVAVMEFNLGIAVMSLHVICQMTAGHGLPASVADIVTSRSESIISLYPFPFLGYARFIVTFNITQRIFLLAARA